MQPQEPRDSPCCPTIRSAGTYRNDRVEDGNRVGNDEGNDPEGNPNTDPDGPRSNSVGSDLLGEVHRTHLILSQRIQARQPC